MWVAKTERPDAQERINAYFERLLKERPLMVAMFGIATILSGSAILNFDDACINTNKHTNNHADHSVTPTNH